MQREEELAVREVPGQPVRGALVEIWQADNNGAYIHSASPIRNRDAAFQGYGKFITGSSGERGISIAKSIVRACPSSMMAHSASALPTMRS